MIDPNLVVKRLKHLIDGGDGDDDFRTTDLLQLLCEHKTWKMYNGALNAWIPFDGSQKAFACGVHCSQCGIYSAHYTLKGETGIPRERRRKK